MCEFYLQAPIVYAEQAILEDAGLLFVADSGNHRVVVYEPSSLTPLLAFGGLLHNTPPHREGVPEGPARGSEGCTFRPSEEQRSHTLGA